MKSTEATVFDRKSGGAEGPAVRLDYKQRPASKAWTCLAMSNWLSPALSLPKHKETKP